MKKTPLRKVSEKQRLLLDEWVEVCHQKMEMQVKERGYIYCEICGLPEKNWEGGVIWGHHLNRNRKDNTLGNCLLSHWVCHQQIHNGKIKIEDSNV